MLIDLFFGDVVAFALVFPAIALATLLAGGRSGLMVLVGGQLLAWYYLVPFKHNFVFATASDAISLVLATLAQLLLLWALIGYRSAERKAGDLHNERNAELERALTLLRQQTETTQKLIEQEDALRATQRNLEAIYQASGDGLALCQAIWDNDGRVCEYQVLEVNRAHATLTGATREQMLSQKVSTIYPPTHPIWFETADKVLKTGVMHDFDIKSAATGRWLNIRVSRVSDDLFQQTFVDISDRQRLDEQRQALMKEMSHRVMNNFQMIAGFLHVQAGSLDGAAKASFQTAESRVHVLAKLHSFLAYTESEGEIDAAAYVRELCGYLNSMIDRPEAVKLVCEADELSLPAEKVVPLGFVISELTTNSAKYAYPPPTSGTIHVLLKRQHDLCVLTIQDEGCGLGASQPTRTGGLGTRLVQRFVQQIDADIVTQSGRGVSHTITFRV